MNARTQNLGVKISSGVPLRENF